MLTPMPRSLAPVALALAAMAACAGKPAGTVSPEDAALTVAPGETAAATSGPATLAEAEAALASGDAVRAVALFSRCVGGGVDLSRSQHDIDTDLRQGYLGLARAHELLSDCTAAIHAYDAYLARFGDGPTDLYARRGACYAELGEWQASADSYEEALTRASLPSAQVEALTRQGYAYFELAQFDRAAPL